MEDEWGLVIPRETLKPTRIDSFRGFTGPLQCLWISKENALKVFNYYESRKETNNLGWCHYFGIGTPENPNEALKCFENAAKAGSWMAKNNILVLGGKEHTNPAVFQSIIDTKDPTCSDHVRTTAEYNLAQCLRRGWGKISVNQAKAQEIFHDLACREHPISVFMMGVLQLNRGYHSSAAAWFLLAAELGLPLAQVKYAEYCENGLSDVKVDLTEAEKWYRLAADQYMLAAILNLAVMHESKCMKTAICLYSFAAEMDCVVANRRLGQIYYFGLRGTNQNHPLALKYENKARTLQGISPLIKRVHSS